MLNADIYFNNMKNNEHIRIENILMIQSICDELIVVFTSENYDYHYTEVKRYPLYAIDYYLVGPVK